MLPVLLVLVLLGGLTAGGVLVVLRSMRAPATQTATGDLRGADLEPAPSTAPATDPSTDPTAAPIAAPNLAPGRFGDATCTDPATRQQWRVSWQATDGPGGGSGGTTGTDLEPTGFAVRSLIPTPTPTATPSSPVWRTGDEARWALQWNPTRAEMLTSARGEVRELTGSRSVLAGASLGGNDSPRYVTPDGGCAVFLAPFGPELPDGTATSAGPVAVLGDDQIAQLYPPDDSASAAGALSRRLTASGRRSEIIGQDHQRWTRLPGSPAGIAQADVTMRDEMRGLREASAMVIALGRDDALWIAQSVSIPQYRLRLAWVRQHLAPILDELRDHGHCTVVVTTATKGKAYPGVTATRFESAARAINAFLRTRADASATDRLKISDWAALADQHTTTASVPWFGWYGSHLKDAGIAAYADALARAATLC